MLVFGFEQLFDMGEGIDLLTRPILSVLNRISVTFVNKDGTEQTIRVPVGMSMLEAAHENDIELEGYNFN
jgi:hypothetical protein